MISISERLRARQEPVGDGSGRWRKDGLCQEAADTIDALVAALEGTLGKWVGLVESGDAGFWDAEEEEHVKASRAALTKAKSCHTGNSARGNAMKDEA